MSSSFSFLIFECLLLSLVNDSISSTIQAMYKIAGQATKGKIQAPKLKNLSPVSYRIHNQHHMDSQLESRLLLMTSPFSR